MPDWRWLHQKEKLLHWMAAHCGVAPINAVRRTPSGNVRLWQNFSLNFTIKSASLCLRQESFWKNRRKNIKRAMMRLGSLHPESRFSWSGFRRSRGQRPKLAAKLHRGNIRPDIRVLPPGTFSDYLTMLKARHPTESFSLKFFTTDSSQHVIVPSWFSSWNDVIVFPYPFTGKIGFWMLDLKSFLAWILHIGGRMYLATTLLLNVFFLPGGIWAWAWCGRFHHFRCGHYRLETVCRSVSKRSTLCVGNASATKCWSEN